MVEGLEVEAAAVNPSPRLNRLDSGPCPGTSTRKGTPGQSRDETAVLRFESSPGKALARDPSRRAEEVAVALLGHGLEWETCWPQPMRPARLFLKRSSARA
jgi:hypothetical protein